MGREKRHDEIYCRSCGEPIKKKAEICPNCGVANNKPDTEQPSQRSQHRSSRTTRTNQTRQPRSETGSIDEQISSYLDSPEHDPSKHTTTISNNWNYGVAVGVGLWLIGFALPEAGGLAGAAFLTAWILMPVSVYFDRQWVRATTQWSPNIVVWLVLFITPVINIPAGVVYLFRRHNASQVSAADRGGHSQKDPALAELREKYSRGELDDVEFEQKVEQIVGTEDTETAQVHMRANESSKEQQDSN